MISRTDCFHCGETLSPNESFPIIYRQTEQPTCCAGCQAVANTIIQSGLDSYYTQRDKPADRVKPLPDELLAQLKLFDDVSLQTSFVLNIDADVREAALILEGISCAACIWLNERHLQALPGVLSASINYSNHRARVRWDEKQIQLSTILQAIAAIGYRAQPYDQARQEEGWQKQRKSALFRLWVAGLSMMQVMMFSVPIYMSKAGEIAPEWLNLMNWASLALTLPVVLYSATPFYISSWRDLKRRRTGMDLPVAIGVLAAFTASCYSLITGHGEIYFDSVSMFVFLLLTGRYLEMGARRKAGAATEQLVKLIPAFAHKIDEQGTSEVTVNSLKIGEQILVKSGETIPADGIVRQGSGEVSEALLTGESLAVPKTAGMNVTGGTLNLAAPLHIEITQIGENTRLAAIVRLLDQALAQKPRLALLAEQVSGWFISILLVTAALAWLYWHLHDPIHALPIMVAVLVISCPCALALATPVALTAATGHLAQLGLMVARSPALETMSQITDVMLDKTGTLTHGEPRIQHYIASQSTEDKARQIAASLESASAHPLARAFVQANAPLAQEIQTYPGGGLSGAVNGVLYFIGHPEFVNRQCAMLMPDAIRHAEGSLVAIASTTEWLGAFIVADTLRADAADAIAALSKAGLRLHLVSGDNNATVQALALNMHIENAVGRATPGDKLAYINTLQQQGRCVLMIGDGVNDAPVLAQANVSMAMGAGVDVAHAAGDMVLLNNQLDRLPKALALAKKTRTIIRQNLAWAIIYNLAALPLAVCGLITPWIASLGMACSSLLVVLNALRLRGKN
ncbi:heavy metal translocating P-type ATPase [Iodobacter fluviatilis]|uniref:Cu2+-exporting ATPase n=1 Tax=Iodobacter fluviatilis TaxID=537 RepID=A0A377Q8Q9_9NEIS|nr:heavy metal translocating P-type ATPase [Iodobacter fluviatilis]TCU89589.1 Cu2+-exporting ATPase [Iodobacter fluviatilis]STQ90959.1 Probable copper-importing P-type ATPase A [Iodobacter fluviatilis]